jgi:hypothetical protein
VQCNMLPQSTGTNCPVVKFGPMLLILMKACSVSVDIRPERMEARFQVISDRRDPRNGGSTVASVGDTGASWGCW